MALTNTEFGDIVRSLRSDITGKTELKSVAILKQALRAGLDAINDDYESRRLTIKGSIDTAMGITTTNAFAKKLGKAWMSWKLRGE